MRALWLGAWVAVLVTAVAAGGCGGTAIIDAPIDGSGGTGASGTGTGTGTPTGTGTGSGTSTGTGPGGPVHEACQEFCAAVQGCAAYPSCVETCAAGTRPECTMPYLALINCGAASMGPPICEFPSVCQDELIAHSLCMEGEEPPPPPGPCGPMGCSVGSDGSCSCEVTCYQTTYTTDCDPMSGTYSCTCLMNLQPVGTCTEMTQFACEPLTGCCATIFFPD